MSDKSDSIDLLFVDPAVVSVTIERDRGVDGPDGMWSVRVIRYPTAEGSTVIYTNGIPLIGKATAKNRGWAIAKAHGYSKGNDY